MSNLLTPKPQLELHPETTPAVNPFEQLAEGVWEKAYKSREAEFKQYAQRMGPKSWQSPEQVIEKEKRFFIKVFALVREKAETHKGFIVVEFDADECILETDQEAEGLNHYDTRPAFGAVMRALDEEEVEGKRLGQRLAVGVMTTKPQQSLEDQPAYLNGVPDVQPEFLISSKELTVGIQEKGKGQDIRLIEDIVDSQVMADAEHGVLDLSGMEYAKLLKFKEQVIAHPDYLFIFVDDMRAPELIRKDHPNLAGVSMASERQNTWAALAAGAGKQVAA
jgi:hypothetical protein